VMIQVAGLSDVGRRRKLNEDSYLAEAAIQFYAVCDGMGGHNAGEVASGMAAQTLADFMRQSHGLEFDKLEWPFRADADLSLDGNRIRTAIKLANERVFQAAASQEDYAGMGTTVVAALVKDALLTVGWAGDSRCYLLREGRLTQLTRDDSWVSAAWSEGILSAEEIEKHPLRNIITKAVGARESIDVDILEQPLLPGDHVLLCTDGLHSMVSDAELLQLLTPMPATLDDTVRRLIDAANERGGKDNVTSVMLSCA
jgi:serine/threonine protein phosphatase PrpC